MTSQDIINKFETQVDDGTELSAEDELSLLNKVYHLVLENRPWEFLKKPFSGSINGTFINLPDDFGFITEITKNEEQKKIVIIGDNEYKLVNFSERRDYATNGYCWVNIALGRLEFNESVNGTVEYDYIYVPEDLEIDDEPVFPSRFSPILYHLMASDDYVIQQFDKARSYANENRAKAEEWLERMAIWNANLQV